MKIKTEFSLLVGLLLSAFALIAVLAVPISPLRLAATMLLVCFLPGWAIVEGLFALLRERPPLEERLLLGLGVGYAVTIIGGLWLYYAFGQLTFASILTLYFVICIVGFGLAIVRGQAGLLPNLRREGLSASNFWLLLGLLLFAAYFRFFNLYFSDYRGDEAEVVMRAVATIYGDGDPIFSHTKGPVEIILSAVFGTLYGAFNELADRVSFALGNWLAVAITFLLGYRLFGRRVAFIAGMLVAIDGWFVAYSRITQYQNVVLPMTLLGVWSYVQFYQGGCHIYHWLGNIFLVVAMFGHYEGGSVAPVFLYLLILSLQRQGLWRQGALLSFQKMWPIGLSVLVGIIILLSFYVPYTLNPTVGSTQRYLANHIGYEQPYNNWDLFYVNGLMFNSIYYVLGIGTILLVGTLRGIYQVSGGGKTGTIVALGALPLLLLSWTGLLANWYAFIVFLGLIGLFLLSPRVNVSLKILLLWILAPFGVYLFLTVRPGNHYYLFMPPVLLLVAFIIDWGWHWLNSLNQPVRRWAMPIIMGTFVILFGLSTWYQQIIYLRTDLEYLLTYPQHRNLIFWSDPRYPFKIRIGLAFPHRLGWQTISELYRTGQLAGDWYGTDEDNSIQWYTLGWPRNPCFPRYYVLTKIGHVTPPLEVPLKTIERYYTLRATVQVNGEARLQLYEFAPEGNPDGNHQPLVYQEPARYPTPYEPSMFRGKEGEKASYPLDPPQRFKPHPEMLAQLADVYNDANTVLFQEEVSLLGYDLDLTWARPGGLVILTLYWRADSPVFLPYKVFTHLGGSQVWAQADDEPGCRHYPTYTWRTGDQFIDRHLIFLPDDIPPGEYPLQVGLYEIRTGLRMDYLDEMGNPAGNALILPPVSIGP